MPRQDSLIDQLRDLIAHANREGMTDAADWLRDRVVLVEERLAIIDGMGQR